MQSIEDRIRTRDRADPFASVREATDVHRTGHCCWAYPYDDGTLLGAISIAVRPSRVLELGTALGYTACWWAAGGARVDTIERDPSHVRLAREQLARHGLAQAVTVHPSEFGDALDELTGPYDLVFFDGYEPSSDLLSRLRSVTADDGLLVTANLDLATGRTLSALRAMPGWTTQFSTGLAFTAKTFDDQP